MAKGGIPPGDGGLGSDQGPHGYRNPRRSSAMSRMALPRYRRTGSQDAVSGTAPTRPAAHNAGNTQMNGRRSFCRPHKRWCPPTAAAHGREPENHPTAVAAAVAQQERRPLFHPDQGDEKQAQVMVHPGGISLCQPAGRAALRVFIHPPGFGLNTGDQKHNTLEIVTCH
jgi:hypothetical protein